MAAVSRHPHGRRAFLDFGGGGFRLVDIAGSTADSSAIVAGDGAARLRLPQDGANWPAAARMRPRPTQVIEDGLLRAACVFESVCQNRIAHRGGLLLPCGSCLATLPRRWIDSSSPEVNLMAHLFRKPLW